MFRIISTVSILTLMTACGGEQPFDFGTTDGDQTTDQTTNTDDTTGTTDDEASQDTGTLDTGTGLPPGTAEPSADGDILRYEAPDGNGGLVRSVAYNAENDTFAVDNLGFDGANVYTRDNQVGSLNSYAVYEASAVSTDSLTGDPIGQITPYRAILGLSNNTNDGQTRTAFAIVRTGGYVDYGFGGFLYSRDGSVTLPTTGQARFSGDYAGIRVFNGIGGMEYTRGDMTIDIDFRDFNTNDAVKGLVFNREAFNSAGDAIPLNGEGELVLPNIPFVVQQGSPSLSPNGELRGSLVNSIYDTETGTIVEYESGTYYGIIAGDMTDPDDGGELVGVFVVESEDPRYEGITAQETGGFILYR